MPNQTKITKIADLIRSGSRFLVTAHEHPDGDALASTLALANALREQGRDVIAFNRDTVPADLEFLPGSDSVRQSLPDAEWDVGFVLDAGDLKRVGADVKACCKDLVNIDHHPYSEQFGVVNLVDTEAAATGILIYHLLKTLDWPISGDVALCIYTAILSDTGSFRYSNANREAFAVAGEMVELGVDPWAVASGLYESQEEMRLRLLGHSLPTLAVSSCGRIAAMAVTEEMMAETGAAQEHTDRFINYPRSVRGVEVALFFRETGPSRYKVGFRSKGNVDVGALARELGGGGHHNAAGASVEGDLATIQHQVFTRLQALLPV
ncbi:MAG: DHH family phosphoesterase [Desulfuromonas sp.]|nr:MAG: DHH family phosphoesterase [Desulfuromonas sp.]